MGAIAQTLTAPHAPLVMYAEKLLVGVKPDQFARQPRGKDGIINTNHPAFIYGHLSIYPTMILGIAGVESAGLTNPDGFDALFTHETICKDDPAGSIYPPMEAITSHFFKAYNTLFEKVAELSDEHLAAPHGQEGEFFQKFPSRAAVIAFMAGPHPFIHIGQMSAWRRCMGLGPAM